MAVNFVLIPVKIRRLIMLKNEQKNIIVCGLGGQGVVLLGRIMGEMLMAMKYQVKVSDVLGLGQRNGEVQCHIRYAAKKDVYSPFIMKGDADYIISFEITEAVRNIHYLKSNGSVITSDLEIPPSSVSIGLQEDECLNKLSWLQKYAAQTHVINIDDSVSQHNSIKQINICMLGFFVNYMGYNEQDTLKIWKRHVNKKFWETGAAAFQYGKQRNIEIDTNV